MEDRLIVDVADLQHVRFACTKCGAAVIISAADFKTLQAHCPGCQRQWLLEGGLVAEQVRRLMHSLRELHALAGDSPIRVGFDLATQP